MTLKSEILARIDTTPHRPPTHRDIIQALYPEPYTTISAQIKALLADGLIDTETGDSGMTYTRRKASAPSPSPHAPTPMPQTAHSGLAFFPSKNANAQPVWHGYNTQNEKATIHACTVPKRQTKKELSAQSRLDKAAKMAAERVKVAAIKAEKPHRFSASHALVTKHLTRPMSGLMFASLASIAPRQAVSMLKNHVIFGRLLELNHVPKIFYFAGMDATDAKSESATFKRSQSLKKLGYDPALIAKEYAEGASFAEIKARHGGRIQTLHECVRFAGGKMRSRAEVSFREQARRRDMRAMAK